MIIVWVAFDALLVVRQFWAKWAQKVKVWWKRRRHAHTWAAGRRVLSSLACVRNILWICVLAQPLLGQPGGQVQWMAAPAAIAGVPAGLEYLTQIDQLLVQQQIEVLERECLVMWVWPTNVAAVVVFSYVLCSRRALEDEANVGRSLLVITQECGWYSAFHRVCLCVCLSCLVVLTVT